METVTAVAGRAGELVVGGRGAAGSGPDTAGPVSVGDGDGEMSKCSEFETAGGENRVAGVGLESWPDGVGAVVYEGEYKRV